MSENPALSDFIERARNVDFDDAIDLVGIKVPAAREYQGPCPRCRDGKDRFSINRTKRVWNCRHCGGGRDAISLVIHCNDLSAQGAGFLEACSMLLREPIPEGGARESDEERAARLERIAAAEARAARNRLARETKDNAYRQREISRGRGLWLSQRARTEYVRMSSKRLSVPPSMIRRIVREAMSAASVDLLVRSPWIPLYALGARQTRSGVSVRLRGSYRSAFLATMSNGHRGVMKRSGKSRLPIFELYGPNPAHDITNNPDDYLDLLSKMIERELLPRMLHELGRLLPG